MTQPQSSNGRAGSAAAVTPAAPATPRRAARWPKLLAALSVLYGVSILGIWAWMLWQGDRQWLATLVLFGPRWLSAIPLPFLALAAAIWNRRLLWVLAVTAIVLFGPFMGYKAHWPASQMAPVGLRVLTFNVDQDAFSKEALAELVIAKEPDVIALQEVTGSRGMIWPDNWQVVRFDEYIIASPWTIGEQRHLPHPTIPGKAAGARFLVRLPDREVQVFLLHLQSPRAGIEAVLSQRAADGAETLDAVIEDREAESRIVSDWIAGFEGPKIVLGDFNLPSDSTIFRRDWTWLSDAFATCGFGYGFTKITPAGYFEYGARIDHILYSSQWRCIRAWVGPDIGSDHLPLLADFD